MFKNVQFILSVFIRPDETHDLFHVGGDHFVAENGVERVNCGENDVGVVSGEWLDFSDLWDQLCQELFGKGERFPLGEGLLADLCAPQCS